MTGGPGTAGPRHRDLLRLLDYWQGKRGVRDFPRRADIDPLDLGFMLDRARIRLFTTNGLRSPHEPNR